MFLHLNLGFAVDLQLQVAVPLQASLDVFDFMRYRALWDPVVV